MNNIDMTGLLRAALTLKKIGRPDSSYHFFQKYITSETESIDVLESAFEDALDKSDWRLASTCVAALLRTDHPAKSDLKTRVLKSRDMLRAKVQATREVERKQNKTALSIFDEISHLNWSTEFTLKPLSKAKAIDQISKEKADFVFLESAWAGNNNDWQYAFTSPGLKHANAQKLLETISAARGREDLPLAIWNKEDPLHYDRFLPIMKQADHIFTTDANLIPKYKSDTSAKTVTALPFGANLDICNPVGRYRENEETVCFAGSYYSEGHDERNRQMGFLLDPIEKYNGAIYDRMSKLNNPRYFFPERFRPFVRDAVGFNEVTKLYRRFKAFLNVNTIINSKTMMSRRVYEILASGTPVISAPSEAIETQFDGIVQVASNAHEANEATERLLTDERFWYKKSQLGIREVVTKHQYKHLGHIVRQAVFGEESPHNQPLISVILATKRSHFLNRIVENISRQKNVRMEVIFAFTDSWTDREKAEVQKRVLASKNVERCQVLTFSSDVKLGSKLDEAIQHSSGEYIAKLDDDDFYFENYLSDQVMCFDFANCDIVGKWTFPVWLEEADKLILRHPGYEHTLTHFVAGPTLVIKRSWYDKIRFNDRTQGEDSDFLRRSHAAGGKIYSSDHFNFIQFRAADSSHHTWNADKELFTRTGDLVGSWDNFRDWTI
jgi:spore maturation protein CgeB